MGFIDAFNRIRLETDLQTQDQLSRFLGIKQGSVSGAKKRGQFPRAWAEKVGRHYGLRYEWIMEGMEPRKVEDLAVGNTGFSFKIGGPADPKTPLPPGMDEEEMSEVFNRLMQILLKAPDEERYKVRGVIDEVFQKVKHR